MSVSGIGSRSTLSVQALVQMRAQLDDLQQQLGTGKKSTTYAGMGLDRGLAVGLRGRLSSIDGFSSAITNVGVRISLANTALARIASIATSVKNTAWLSPYDLDSSGMTSAQRNASSQLDELLSLLNSQSGDRYLFGGRDVTHPPVDTMARIVDGDATHAGLTQVMAERAQADLGADGLGRLVASVPSSSAAQLIGAGATLSPDAPAVTTGGVDLTALASAGGTLELNGVNITINPGGAASVLADINAQLGLTGVQASQDGNGHLVLTGADADTAVTIGAASAPAQLLADLGIAVGTQAPTNLLTQGAVTGGQTLTVAVGANPALTITFGNGAGEVSTLAELNAALGALAGGAASVDPLNGNLSITAGNATDAITVGGTASAATFGLQATSNGPGGTFTLAEDVAGSPFGFKIRGVGGSVAGVSGPAGSPATATFALTTNPTAGQTVRIDLTLPDGSVENVALTATTSTPAGSGQFTIGATPAATAQNLSAALTGALGTLARTALTAASAIAAGHDFFDIGAGQAPQRVAGPPFATASALVSGTTANTVFWYTGEVGTDSARDTASARVDEQLGVSYGLRANEEALRWTVEHVAVFAAMKFSSTDPDAQDRFSALKSRLGPLLAGPANGQKIESIQADLAGAQSAISAAKDRHTQVTSTLQTMLTSIEGVSNEEVGATILALQTRLQATLQTTALLARTSIIDYL